MLHGLWVSQFEQYSSNLYILYWFSIFLFVVNVAGLFILSMATLVPANKGNKFLCGIIYNYIDCAKFLFQID